MKKENPSWGAPRIHRELLLLGFNISEPTVSRYLRQLKRMPDETKASQWRAFLNNHREVIAAFDFFMTLAFAHPTELYRETFVAEEYLSVIRTQRIAAPVDMVDQHSVAVLRARREC
jgi:hypothetical protein